MSLKKKEYLPVEAKDEYLLRQPELYIENVKKFKYSVQILINVLA